MMEKLLVEMKAMERGECAGSGGGVGASSQPRFIREGLDSLRKQFRELAAMAVTLLRADSCRIEFNADTGEGWGFAVESRVSSACTSAEIFSPIVSEGRKLGAIKVERAARKPHFNEADEQLLGMVATLASCLHRADSSKAESSAHAIFVSPWQQEIANISRMGGLGECPHEMARIVARSFYREMTKAGMSQSQIIKVASEIISELSMSVRRHSKRITAKST